MKRVLYFILICACMCACKTQKVVTEYHDTLYVSKVQVDTFYQSKVEFDSVFVRDSVFLYANDSVTVKEVWKWREKYIFHHDTIHDKAVLCDTVYKTKKEYVATFSPLSKLQQLELDAFPLICTVLVVAIGCLIIPIFKKD